MKESGPESTKPQSITDLSASSYRLCFHKLCYTLRRKKVRNRRKLFLRCWRKKALLAARYNRNDSGMRAGSKNHDLWSLKRQTAEVSQQALSLEKKQEHLTTSWCQVPEIQCLTKPAGLTTVLENCLSKQTRSKNDCGCLWLGEWK